MPDECKYHAFLSHSAKDKAVVRPLAERLRKDGLKLWFDEWEIKPGDSIPAKIETRSAHSNILRSDDGQMCGCAENPAHNEPCYGLAINRKSRHVYVAVHSSPVLKQLHPELSRVNEIAWVSANMIRVP